MKLYMKGIMASLGLMVALIALGAGADDSAQVTACVDWKCSVDINDGFSLVLPDDMAGKTFEDVCKVTTNYPNYVQAKLPDQGKLYKTAPNYPYTKTYLGSALKVGVGSFTPVAMYDSQYKTVSGAIGVIGATTDYVNDVTLVQAVVIGESGTYGGTLYFTTSATA